MRKLMEDIFSKLIFSILKYYMKFIITYHFYQKVWKLKKIKKLLTNLHDKTEYVIHIRNSKQALNRWLILKNVHKLIKCNQKAWLKPYIDMNYKLRHKTLYSCLNVKELLARSRGEIWSLRDCSTWHYKKIQSNAPYR